MKRNTSMLVILIFSFLILEVKAETKKLQPIDYSSPVIQAVIARQEAFRDNDRKTLWEQWTKKIKDGWYKGMSPGRLEEKARIGMGNAKLIGMKFITDNRAWVEVRAPGLPDFKGFYLIKENGKWKFANIQWYVKRTKEEIESLGKAIQDYYIDNKKLPQTLSDVLEPIRFISNIPLDLFNDNEAPYVYKVIDKTTCRIYSLGPDNRDDQGKTVYQKLQKGALPISKGDIVKDFSFK